MENITTAPEGLGEEAAKLWLEGTSDFTLRRGDLWTLAWDGHVLGHVMIAALKDDFFLGWPVTLPAEPSFAPGMLFEASFGTTVTVWPTRETGLGLHLLERPLGPLLETSEIRRIACSLDDGEKPEGRYAAQTSGNPAFEEVSSEMARKWAGLCFHTGRSHDNGFFLDQDKVRKLGGTAREIAELLQLSPAQTRTYWDGQQELPVQLAESLRAHFRVEIAEIIRDDPAERWWEMLALPTFKAEVEAACLQRGQAEEIIRLEAVRSAYGLAARQDSDELAEQKLRDAIRRTVWVRPE